MQYICSKMGPHNERPRKELYACYYIVACNYSLFCCINGIRFSDFWRAGGQEGGREGGREGREKIACSHH